MKDKKQSDFSFLFDKRARQNLMRRLGW